MLILVVPAKVKGADWEHARHIPGEQRSTCAASPKRRAVSVATADGSTVTSLPARDAEKSKMLLGLASTLLESKCFMFT